MLATAHVENPASRRVLDKCGFEHIGTGLEGAPARGGMVPCDRFRLERAVWASRRAPTLGALPTGDEQRALR
jgi:RimJ/RimL family protein N-acetyltransferase